MLMLHGCILSLQQSALFPDRHVERQGAACFRFLVILLEGAGISSIQSGEGSKEEAAGKETAFSIAAAVEGDGAEETLASASERLPGAWRRNR